MQPTLKRLLTTKKEPTKKYITTLSTSQEAFCAESATLLRNAASKFESENAASLQQFTKFFSQLQLVLSAVDTNVMLTQFKSCLSARPASNTLISDNHPIMVAIHILNDLFFDYAPRAIVRELLRLLSFLMTPVGSEAIEPNSVCALARREFLSRWTRTLKTLDQSASLSLVVMEDGMDEATFVNMASSVNNCDLLWSVFLSTLPSLLGLFEDKEASEIVLCFLVRMMQHVSRDQSQLDFSAQFFSVSTIESLLVSLHGLLKMYPFREKLEESIEKLVKSCGFDLEVVVVKQWNDGEMFQKLVQSAIPAKFEDRYGHDAMRVLGGAMNATLALLLSRNCSKDTTHAAGLLAAFLASEFFLAFGRTHPSWTQSQLVSSFYPSLSSLPPSSLFSPLNILSTGPSSLNPFPSHRFDLQFIESLPHPALITLLRGLIVCFGTESLILIAPCSTLAASSSNLPSSSSSPSHTPSDPKSNLLQRIGTDSEPGCILFDALLPWFLKFSETSCERYARFLAVKSAGTCVEFLIKGMTTLTESATPPDATLTKVLKIKVERSMDQLFELIWKNWEDPFDSIVSEIGAIFPLVLDTGEKAFKVFGSSSNFGADFADRLASHLLHVDLATKGKYPLLCLLIQRIGPVKLLQLKPNFLEDLFTASSFALAGRSVGPVINAFIVSMHALTRPPKVGKRAAKSKNVPVAPSEAVESWDVDPIKLITGPLAASLLKQETLVPVSLYALPHIFELFPQCLDAVLQCLVPAGEGKEAQSYEEDRVKAVLAVLKVGRASGLIDNMDFTKPEFMGSKSVASHGMLVKLVEEALMSHDINLRLDALQLMVETRKASELPTSVELNALILNVDHNMLETSLVYRNRSLNLLDQSLLRFKESIKHHYKLPARTLEAQQSTAKDARNAIAYLDEFASTLLHCLYIPAPPHRRFTALEGLKSLVAKFGPEPTKGSNFGPYIDIAFADNSNVTSKQIKTTDNSEEWKKLQLFSPAATLSLLAGLWDQYDAARVLSFDLLKLYPSPLPGFESPEALRPLWRWALSSVSSPRMREADSGSLALRLIASSYIVRSGWSLRMKLIPTASTNASSEYSADLIASEPSESPSHFIERMVDFCNDVLDIVLVHVAETRKNRKHASMHFPVHGPLMALRYIINDVNVASLDDASTKHWRTLVERMISVANIVSALALELKYPLRYTHNEHGEVDHSQDHDGAGEGEDDDVLEPIEMVVSGADGSKSAQQPDNAKKETLVGGTTEGIIVAMWLSVKEVSFLLGCLVKTSIHAAVSELSKSHAKHGQSSQVIVHSVNPHPTLPLKMISVDEIRAVGQHLLDTLLVLRHRGAMETTSEGFQLICECILSTNDRNLHSLVSQWLAQLLDRIDNTPWALLSTRRSAGLPYAFMAILRSETVAADRNRFGKTMLPLVFAHLLATASRNGWSSQPTLSSIAKELIPSDSPSQEGYSPENPDDADVGRGKHSNHSPKEHRHQVHALNVIRAIIRDRTIIDDIAPYVESVLTLVLNLYHSPHWAVQNSATMAFSTLLERTAGGSKLANMTSASAEENTNSAQSPPGGTIAPRVRAPKLTAVDFFARYPIAHAALIAALSKATFTTANPGFVQLVFKGVIDSQQFPAVMDLLHTISSLVPEQAEDTSLATDANGEQSASSSLYAVLLLLSRMTPSKVASTQRQSHVAPFVLLTCSAALSNANAMVRVLASKALAPLISTPSMPHFVKSMTDAIPNSSAEHSSLMKSLGHHSANGAANQLHGLFTLILQLLRTHVPILISASQNPNQYVSDIGSFNTTESSSGTSPSQASFASSCTTQLAFLRGTVLPSLVNKLWLLKAKIAPVTCVLLSILSEFVILPVCVSPSLLADYPPLSSLVTATVSLSSLFLRRKASELVGKGDDSENISVRTVMEDVMVHRQYKYFGKILVKALLQLSEHLNLKAAHMNDGTIQDSLEALIAFPIYEVRLGVYKLLTQAVGTSDHLNKQTLAKKLLQLVGFLPVANVHGETHPKCILRIIRLLNMLGEMGALTQLLKESKEIVPEKVVFVLQSWAIYEPDAPSMGTPLSRYCKTNTIDDTVADSGVSTSLRQDALAFMAFFLRNVQDMYSGDTFLSTYLPMLSWWLDMVERHSRYELATTDRFSAALSLSRHPLHFARLPPSPQVQQLIVDYWMLIVRLLQDDDESTRDLARTVVSALRSSNDAIPESRALQSKLHAPAVRLDPGLMVCTQFCFEYLSLNVPDLPHYWKWLVSGLCPTFSTTTEKGADFILEYWAKNVAFSTQLFEQEKANFFHEPVLISQLCCAHILAMHQSGDMSSEIAAHLTLVRAQVEQNLVGLVQALASRISKDSLVTNMHAEWQTMYEQVFTPLYCLMMGIHTCLKVAPPSSSLQITTIEALRSLSRSGAGTLHPVLNGLTQKLLITAGQPNAAAERFIFSSHLAGNSYSSPTATEVLTPADTWHKAPHARCQDTDFLLPRNFN